MRRLVVLLLALSLAATAPAQAETVQRDGVRVSVQGRLDPTSLPRRGSAPVAVGVSGRIAAPDGGDPPQLLSLRIELNRHGHLDPAAAPVCPYARIQPASSARALAACRRALVGRGHFDAEARLPGQEPYPTGGELLLFNGRDRGRPALLGQIYSPRPFATSFVIDFAIRRDPRGAFGTELVARLPHALTSWGYVTGISINLSAGAGAHPFLSAGCPAPAGFPSAVFPLARATFGFSGGRGLDVTVTKSCRAKG